MALGRQQGRQAEILVTWAELPRAPGHAFYDRLQAELIGAGFDGFVEGQCAGYYAARRGRPSLPPGRYFRMLLVGYFEGIDSERGLEWRCADSLSLREFLRLGERDPVPDHSWLSRTRGRLPLEVHDKVFTWVLQRLAQRGLIKGERIGVDASTIEANAALRTIVRRDNGEGYREMLTRMAKESGIETPTAEDLIRLDRARKGKKLSNTDWESPTDPEAKIAKLKDGRTHLAYKPEHAMDLDTGAVVAAEVHAADQGDTSTMPATLASAAEHLATVNAAPTPEAPAELIADKGYHSRGTLKTLDDGPWKTRISEPQRDAFSRWHGDDAARRAVYNNRTRLLSGVARAAFKLRAERVERGFALVLDRGGMRRAWLRGRENVQKRYLIHVAGYNLGLIMRLLAGAGTPRELQTRTAARLFVVITPNDALTMLFVVAVGDQAAVLIVTLQSDPFA
jgi:transposase